LLTHSQVIASPQHLAPKMQFPMVGQKSQRQSVIDEKRGD
jgi:hypothetical protein